MVVCATVDSKFWKNKSTFILRDSGRSRHTRPRAWAIPTQGFIRCLKRNQVLQSWDPQSVSAASNAGLCGQHSLPRPAALHPTWATEDVAPALQLRVPHCPAGTMKFGPGPSTQCSRGTAAFPKMSLPREWTEMPSTSLLLDLWVLGKSRDSWAVGPKGTGLPEGRKELPLSWDQQCLKARSHESSHPRGRLSKDCPSVVAAVYPSAESPVVILTRFTRFGIPAAITVPCSWIVGKIKRERT